MIAQEAACIYMHMFHSLRECFNKKNVKSYGIFHTGGVYPISITFFGKKNVFFIKKYKDDQNSLIHPEK